MAYQLPEALRGKVTFVCPASITKAQLKELAARYGHVNAESYKLAGPCDPARYQPVGSATHEPRTLRYVTFSGALNEDTGLYDGWQCYARLPGPDSESPTCDFDELDVTKMQEPERPSVPAPAQ